MPGGLDAGLPGLGVRPDLDIPVALPWQPGVAGRLREVTGLDNNFRVQRADGAARTAP